MLRLPSLQPSSYDQRRDLSKGDARLLGAATALAALDLPADNAPLSLEDVRPLLYQWLAVLEAAGVAELEGLTDDLRVLAARLDSAFDKLNPRPLWAAVHRAGLSIGRVAALSGVPVITRQLLRLGRRLARASEKAA